MTVVWSPRAIGHLAALRDYIARENPGAAARTATALLASVDRLAELPNLGGGPVEYPALVSSWCQAHGTSFRTECAPSVWRSLRCSMDASAGRSACKRSDTAQTRLPRTTVIGMAMEPGFRRALNERRIPSSTESSSLARSSARYRSTR